MGPAAHIFFCDWKYTLFFFDLSSHVSVYVGTAWNINFSSRQSWEILWPRSRANFMLTRPSLTSFLSPQFANLQIEKSAAYRYLCSHKLASYIYLWNFLRTSSQYGFALLSGGPSVSPFDQRRDRLVVRLYSTCTAPDALTTLPSTSSTTSVTTFHPRNKPHPSLFKVWWHYATLFDIYYF